MSAILVERNIVSKFIPVLIKHHAITTCGESSYIPTIFNLGTIWSWVVSFTLLPLYPLENNPLYPSYWWLGLDLMKQRKYLHTTGNQTQIPWSSTPVS
jgi:hypothetical protein